jgi:hypothetical protein
VAGFRAMKIASSPKQKGESARLAFIEATAGKEKSVLPDNHMHLCAATGLQIREAFRQHA